MWALEQLVEEDYIAGLLKRFFCYDPYSIVDNLHYRLIFDLNDKNEIPGKNLLKVVIFQNLVKKCCNV